MGQKQDDSGAGPERVEAALTFAVDTGVKPVAESTGPAGHIRHVSGEYEDRVVPILNGRKLAEPPALEREGFTLVAAESAVARAEEPAQHLDRYYAEVESLVKARTGAQDLHVFDHTLRTGDPVEQRDKRLREPVRVAHNDYTEWSGPNRLRELLGKDPQSLAADRFAVIQLWRPIKRPAEADPLALCDGQSLAADDLIAAERRHKARVGEIYQAAYNPHQRWIYFPEMAPEEAILFKVYDSARDGRARFVPHVSFLDPTARADAPPRESLEVRMFAFF